MKQVRAGEIKARDSRWIESSFREVVDECTFPEIEPEKFKEEIES